MIIGNYVVEEDYVRKFRKAEITYNKSCTVEGVSYLKWKEVMWLEHREQGGVRCKIRQESDGRCQASQGLLNLKSFSPEQWEGFEKW